MITRYADSDLINDNIIYDFIFIGLGASNSLIVLSLLKNGAIADKKVAIIEADSKNTNDKTYCFWASPNDSIVIDLTPIITHCYTEIKVNQSVLQNIEDQPYYYIRSIDLYQHTLEALNQAQITIYRDAVVKVSCENEICSVYSTKVTYQARHIFDSRYPALVLLSKNEIYLQQSFYGLHIRCEKDVFQKHSFEMMNLNVEQSNYTQFIYILPFSSRESLVELTRFGANKLDLDYAKDIVGKFISKNFGNYEILADEVGCIPMTTYINPPSQCERILNTGASANLIKPSTGYGFKNMYINAQRIAERIVESNYKQFNQMSITSKKRFNFYDRLLLTILLYWPYDGKKIFSRLFKKQSIPTIFLFLDERTSLYLEFKIFMSLPIVPFLKALLMFIQKENWIRYVVALIVVSIYLIVEPFSSYIASYISYFILISGLLVIGIPHGALDHMLIKDERGSLYQFVFKYLILIGLYFALWHYLPILSLIIFIVFSSLHFGESELEETGINISSLGSYIKAFVLGICILVFIISTHFEESMNIISNMKAIQFKNDSYDKSYIYSFFLASFSFLYIISQSVISKKYTHLGLIFLIVIGVKVPLVLAFGLYFIFQHSYNAWSHLKIGLNMNTVSLYKKASPYILGALIILTAIVVIDLKNILNIDSFWASFFIFLACISLPHFLLMHLFYRAKHP